MAIVIQRTVLSGLLMSSMPVAMAQIARKTALLNIFMANQYMLVSPKVKENIISKQDFSSLLHKNMTTLYLVRHGETVDNVKRIMQGQTQGELTANGREQAREVAARMASVHIDAFVSSDLKRSYDTCCIIAEPHGAAVTTTPLLRERDWGGFTGRYIPDLKDGP